MRWINADTKITAQLYDGQHEEFVSKEMTVEDYLDAYTDEGCPSIVEAEPVKRGRWVEDEYGIPHCSECGTINNTVYRNYCPNCGARMMDLTE